MSQLTAEQLAELHGDLQRDHERLLRSIRISEEVTAPVKLDQTAVGRLSRMDAMQSQAMQKGLHERELGRLGEIESALRRIADGTYGTCMNCHGPIPYGRLLVIPESRSCAACGGR